MAKKKATTIQISYSQCEPEININKRKVRQTVIKLLEILDCLDKEISLSFVDDIIIQQLNKQYLNKDSATNVLSFPMQEGKFNDVNPQILGDIVISVDTAKRDALQEGLTLKEEIDFLIIHGLLHLLGYNHENTSKNEAQKMRKKEKELFELLLKNQETC